MYKTYIKPLFDFFGSIIALVLFSPIILVLIVILYFVNNGKPFFLQERPGKNEVIFKIIKFKTMKDLDANSKEAHSLKRITKIGAIIRKYSLDELLQLVNVLKGDMSFIGPRPLLIKYLPLYDSMQKTRHHVKPGITGWAQVKGRNSISWDQKFSYDVWYVNKMSFLLDLKILFLTLLKVIKKEGVNTNSNMTMSTWEGNNN